MAVVWPSKNNFANGDVLTATNMNNIGDTLNVFNPTSATNGQVWTANGSGSGSYQTLSPASYTSLATGTISSATTVTISSISQAYTHVELWIFNISLATTDQLYVDMSNGTFPGGAGVFTSQTINISNTTASGEGSQGTSGGFCRLILGDRNISASNTENFLLARFQNYSSATANRKLGYGFAAYRTGASPTQAMDTATGVGNLTTAAAYDQIRIFCTSTITSGNWQLWGIK
jgi:hypothetical protein